MIKNSVLALDPTSKLVFRYDLESHSYRLEEKYSEVEKDKIESELRILESLRGFDMTGWTFLSENCNNYRRRAIWPYLLQPECSRFPCFISSRELSSAFANVTNIKVLIDVTKYSLNTQNSSSNSEEDLKIEESDDIQFDKNEKLITLGVSLMFTAKETIKHMKDQVFEEFGIQIVPFDSKNELVLKVKGRKEYFTGNYPLFAYRQIREYLRGMEFLILNLTEIPKKPENSFPIFVNNEEEIPKIQSLLMFYTPLSSNSEVTMRKPRIFLLNSRKTLKDRKSITENLLKGKETPLKAYTGECDWPFRVKICGVENLFNLFAEAYRGSATNNGNDHPSYVILPKVKEKSSKGHKPKKTDTLEERKLSIPLLKFKSRASASKAFGSLVSNSNYLNHGPSCNAINELANEFKLPFSPYLLSLDVMLIYGEGIIKDSLIRTQYCPFRFNASLHE